VENLPGMVLERGKQPVVVLAGGSSAQRKGSQASSFSPQDSPVVQLL
jgi:hypothetical protein